MKNPAYWQASATPKLTVDPRNPGMGKGRAFLVAAATVTVLLVVAAACAGGSSGGAAPAPTPTATATPTAEPTPTEEPVEEPAVDLAAYLDLSERIATTTGEMSDAALAADVDALDSACTDLGEESLEGAALPDSGIPDMDVHWDKAMTHYAATADACLAGDYDASATAADKATAEINKATAAVEAFSG